MPYDGQEFNKYKSDADKLRRIADMLEKHVQDEEYNQAQISSCALGHAMKHGIIVHMVGYEKQFNTTIEWIREFNLLFGGTPLWRSRTQEIVLLRETADHVESLAVEEAHAS